MPSTSLVRFLALLRLSSALPDPILVPVPVPVPIPISTIALVSVPAPVPVCVCVCFNLSGCRDPGAGRLLPCDRAVRRGIQPGASCPGRNYRYRRRVHSGRGVDPPQAGIAPVLRLRADQRRGDALPPRARQGSARQASATLEAIFGALRLLAYGGSVCFSRWGW